MLNFGYILKMKGVVYEVTILSKIEARLSTHLFVYSIFFGTPQYPSSTYHITALATIVKVKTKMVSLWRVY